MSRQWKVGRLGSRGRIDRRGGAPAVSDQDAVGPRIDADIVRIITQIDAADFGIIRAAEQTDRSVTAICDVKRIARRLVGYALRFRQSRDDVNDLALLEIDNSKRVVFKFRNKQPALERIKSHMIDPPLDRTEDNLVFEIERRRFKALGR